MSEKGQSEEVPASPEHNLLSAALPRIWEAYPSMTVVTPMMRIIHKQQIKIIYDGSREEAEPGPGEE